MAIAGNRSPSPTPNSRINSNIRNSEINSPMRKSFGGNPFPRPSNSSRSFVPQTPANSPADFPSRNFSTKEEKENEKNHHTPKHMKARSPSVPKATNHFMIPTISAASKINPSPRKKVLADRNEPIRNSLSSANFSDDIQDFDKKQVNAVSNTPFIPNFSPKVSNIAPLDADPSLPPYDPKKNYLSPRPQFLHYRPNPRLELYYQEQGSETKNLEDSFLHESFSSESEVSEGSEAESSNKESEDGSSVEGTSEIVQIEAEYASSVEILNNKDEAEGPKLELISKNTEVFEGSEAQDVSPVEGTSEIVQIEAEYASSVEILNNKDEAEGPKLELISKNTEVFEGSEAQDVSPVEAIIENSQNEPITSLASIQVSKDTELENASVVDIVSKEDEPISNPISTHVPKETSEEKREAKFQLFKRVKFPLLLFFLIACFAVSFIDSPISSAPAYEKFSSSKFYEKLSSSKFYEESVNDVARNMKLWSVYSASYVNELISSFSGVEKLGPMQFSNLTYNQEDPFIHTKRVGEIFEQDEVENMFEYEDEFERLLEETLENDDQNIGRERGFDIVSDLPKSGDFEGIARLEAVEFIPKEAEIVKEDDEGYTSEIAEKSEIVLITTAPSFGNTFEYTPEEVAYMILGGDHVYNSDTAKTMGNTFDNHLVSDSEIVSSFKNTLGKESSQVDPEYNCERSEIGEIKYDGPLVSESETEPTKVEPDSENTLNMDDSTLGIMPNNESSKRYKTLAISLLVIALLAAPFLMYLKNKNANTRISATDPISTKKWTKSNTTPQSYSPESEMSSFDGSVSYSKGYTWGITNEAHSQERKQKRVLKRESLASSSGFSVSDSPSYGSFTTYERLQSKHGYGDDEVTPVRRSSRIKKIQVTPP